MSIDNITKKILEDAKLKEKDIVEKAEKKAKEIIKNSEASIKKMAVENIEKAHSDGAIQKEKLIQNAHLKVRNAKLEAKQKVIDVVFDKAVKELELMDEKAFEDFFKSILVKEEFKGDGEIIVNDKRHSMINSKAIKEVNKQLNSNLCLCEADNSIEDGFVIKQGNIYYNFTFKALVGAVRNDMISEISKELF